MVRHLNPIVCYDTSVVRYLIIGSIASGSIPPPFELSVRVASSLYSRSMNSKVWWEWEEGWRHCSTIRVIECCESRNLDVKMQRMMKKDPTSWK